ncbi:MAG TPA: hypothetical protein VFK44_00965 [Bacillales bacterium]|nr:hypothetical protein [Bacillales bacterium]
MDLERFMSYFDTLFTFYASNQISIRWKRNAMGIISSVDLESELKQADSSFSEEEFLDVAFETLSLVKSIVMEEPISAAQEKIEAVEKTFLKDKKDREFIYIQCSTNLNSIDEIDYEVLTKRNENNFNNVAAYSSLLNIKYSDPDISRTESPNKLVVELSRKEIEVLIKDFQKILETLNDLERKESHDHGSNS